MNMKNFIELNIEDERMLININNIVSIKEEKKGNRHFCEIHLNDNEHVYLVDDANGNEPTKYIVKKDLQNINIPIEYDVLKQKIIDATP